MKKISAFITKWVENVVPVLQAVDAAADAFGPLKSAVGGALYILNAYTEFKSNQEEWKAFGKYVAQAVACVTAAVYRNGNPADFDTELKKLASTLDDIVAEIKKEASGGRLRRFQNFLKDREQIPALEATLNQALSTFNLGTTVDARNELAKTFTNTEKLLAGIKDVASDVKLGQLKVADGSSWNRQKLCQEGTRSDLLAKLEYFASARDASSPERVFLLSGVAGCGKTAIAQSLAERLSKQKWPKPTLGACFNFSAQVEDRRTTKLLFSTIALSLSSVDPKLEASVVDALSRDRTLPTATLIDQFRGLIQIPLSTLPNSPPHPTVLILDALDEISDKDGLESLLDLLADDFSQLPASCRVIVTSRPDPTILHRLESSSLRHIVRQQIEHRDSASLSDLRLVAHAKLENIRIGRNMERTWLEPDLEEQFVQKAAGLFVWVEVACKAIGKSALPAQELRRLLAGFNVGGGMNELYVKVLDGCPWDQEPFSSNYGLVLGTVVALRRPLSAGAINKLIGSLLEEGVGDVEAVLEPLASVMLGLPTLASHSSPSRPLEMSHESFREFVTKSLPAKKRNYAVDELESSRRLAVPCLRVLNDELPLHADMVRELFPDTNEARDIPSPKDGIVSETLGYACDHWMGHLSVVTTPTLELINGLHQFLRTNLIPWMKLCASKGQFHGVGVLQTWLTQHRPDVGIDFMSEANLNDLAQCLKDISGGLEYMQRLEEVLVACKLWVAVERQLINRDPTRPPNILARSLNNLSNRLSDLGRQEEALIAIEEAARIYRQLATERPAAFNPDLAMSLNNLSNRLSDLGRQEEALVAIEEAARMYRQLATERPAAFNPDLAKSLSNLSNGLSDLGRREEALVAIEEAARIYRQHATERPAAFNPDLASSLANLSNCLSGLGRREEALVAIEEAVRIRRVLATDRPAAFNSNLAMSLNNLSMYLSDLGRPDEALAAIEEAVRIRRVLATDRPAAFNSDLADSLNNLSMYLSDLGRPDEALVAIEEAARIHRQLAAERPAAFNSVLATSLNNLSSYLSDLGRPGEALVAIEEAVGICRALATERPAAFNPDLARSLNNLSSYLSELGRREEALVANEEAVRIRRVLATDRPAAFNSDLASSLNNLSIHLSDLGRPGEALGAIEETARIYRQLATDRPAAFNSDLALSLANLSNRLSDLGRREEALVAIEEAVALYHPLASQYPARFKSTLANFLGDQAELLAAMGREVEAELARAERAALM